MKTIYTLATVIGLLFSPFTISMAAETPDIDSITIDVIENDNPAEITNEIEVPENADHEARHKDDDKAESEDHDKDSSHDDKDDSQDESHEAAHEDSQDSTEQPEAVEPAN